MVAAPGLGGALMNAIGPAMSLLVDAFTYLYSFVCLRKMRFIEPEPTGAGTESMLRAVSQGFREVATNPYLRSITLVSGALTFVSGIGFAMLVPFASRILALSSASIGVALSMLGTGAIIGSIISSRAINRLGLGRGLVIGLLLDIPGFLLAALAFGSHWLAMLMLAGRLFVVGVVSPIYDINQFSLRQAITPVPLRGRMVATTRVVIRGCAALGALAGGVVAELIGLRGAVIVGSLPSYCR